ncbi:MAG: polysaccharide lyase, partial [Sandaracinaceae bacterium]|nr:polysaccharide lyase [Sandaracinaceae bacterium]
MQHGIRPRTGLGTVVCAGLWLAATGAAAQVSLSDGLWSTSFIGCPTGDLGAGDVCDGLRAVSPEYVCGSSPARHSQIASEANYPGGAGGNGFALYYEGNARNIFSTGLLLEMSPPQPELWLRFYRMWPVGQTWGGILEHKIIYLFTDAGVALNINYPQGEDDIGVQPRNTMGSPDLYYPGNGWRTLNGGELVGDGAWHAFEIHVRLGTAGANDGLFEMWIDGEPVVSITGMDFFDGGARSPTGFSEVELPSNHNVSTLAGCAESRVDDIALAVPGYAGFTLDPQGRSMIGLLGARPAPA